MRNTARSKPKRKTGKEEKVGVARDGTSSVWHVTKRQDLEPDLYFICKPLEEQNFKSSKSNAMNLTRSGKVTGTSLQTGPV